MLDDYAAARDLLVTTFDVVTSDGLTPAVREVVEAIEDGEEATQGTLCERLGLAKSTVSWRVTKALAGGWLVNNETRKGQAHKLARSAPLPEQAHALPISEVLRAAFERSSAVRTLFEANANIELPETTVKPGVAFERSNDSRQGQTSLDAHDGPLQPTGNDVAYMPPEGEI